MSNPFWEANRDALANERYAGRQARERVPVLEQALAEAVDLLKPYRNREHIDAFIWRMEDLLRLYP